MSRIFPRQAGKHDHPGIRWLALVLIGAAFSCGEKDEPTAFECRADWMEADTSFQKDVLLILDESCLGCHSRDIVGPQRLGAPPEVNLDTRNAAAAWSTAIEAQIQLSAMPPSFSPTKPLDERGRCRILDWINDGLLE